MNKIIRIILIGIVAAGIIYWSFQFSPGDSKDEDDHTFIFVCPSGNEIKIRYQEGGNSASLFVDGGEHELHRAISASGARYTNDDETVVFWEHQGEALVEIDGERIYKECKLKK